MKKVNSKLKYLVYAFFLLLGSFVKVNAESVIDIHFDKYTSFVSSAEYSGVNCTYSGNLDVFEFTNNYDDYYVRVVNPKVSDASASAVCTYQNHYATVGDSREWVGASGTLEFTFKVTQSVENIKRIKLYMDRQFITKADMSSYLTQKVDESIDSFALSDDFKGIFDLGADNSVICNNETCLLTLLPTADVGVTTGILYYGDLEIELVVDVSEYWMVQASAGYGTCAFDDTWEISAENNLFTKFAKENSITLPSCTADATKGNTYTALEFVGWVYAQKDATSVELSPSLYQSAGTCSLFAKASGTYTDDELARVPNIESMKEYVGYVPADTLFTPSSYKYAASADSTFFACYKRSGIAFNLSGAQIVDDEYGIASWDVYNGTYYRNQAELGRDTIVLPSIVKGSALRADYQFIGWDNGHTGYNGSNPSVLLQGGDVVRTDSGYIYQPIFVRTQSQSYITKSVYVGKRTSFIPPEGFVCENFEDDNYSITSSNGECIITGLKSTNGIYESYQIENAGRIFTVNISVLSTTGGENLEFNEIEIGDGDIIINDDSVEYDSSTSSIPSECNSYFVGSSMANSPTSFTYKLPNYMYRGQTKNLGTYYANIHTYYAVSNCDDTEYLALCIDPGRTGPNATVGTRTKNGYTGIDYKFDSYIDPTSPNPSYAEFSRGVAHIITKVGNIPLDVFAHENNKEKIAANIALRIISFHVSLDLTPDTAEDDNGEQAYLKGYAAYDLIAKALNDKLVNGTVTKEDLLNIDTANMIWTEFATQETVAGSSESDSIIELVVDYVNYNKDSDIYDPSSWLDEPTLSPTNPDNGGKDQNGNYVFKLQIPELATLTYENGYTTGVGIQISSRIASSFEIVTGTYYDSLNNEVIVNKTIDSDGNEIYNFKFRDCVNPEELDPIYDVIFKLEANLTGDISFPSKGSRDLALFVNYVSSFSKQNAFLVTPAFNENSVQRMVLFKPDGTKKWFSLDIMNCNYLLTNYGEQTEYFESIYQAGCCDTILNDNDDFATFYNAMCKKNCVANTFVPVCSNNGTDQNVYNINEATQADGTVNYKCIVDIKSGSNFEQAKAETSSMTDVAGNKISIADYDNNAYCRVTCKEDIQFNMPGFGNFIDQNAIKAGSLFQINDSIELHNTTTCVTSYIDYEQYVDDVEDNVKKMVDSYNKLMERTAAHSDLAIYLDKIETWYTYDVTNISCSASDFSNPLTSGFCSVSGNYTFTHTNTCTSMSQGSSSDCVKQCACPAGSTNSECLVGDTYSCLDSSDTYETTSTQACTVSDLTESGSFENKANSTNNCSIDGSYKKVTQHNHDGDDAYGKCMVYTVKFDGSNTQFTPWNYNGSALASRPHGSTNSYTTDFAPGASNVCGSDGATCYVSNRTDTSSGSCETKGTDRANQIVWKNNIIDSKIKFDGDANYIRQQIDAERSNILNYQSKIDSISTEFGKCQNFYINNTTAGSYAPSISGAYGTSTVYYNGNLVGNPSNSIVSIDVKFDPKGTFGYDETSYMAQIGAGNNIIARNGDIDMSAQSYGYLIDQSQYALLENFAQYYGETDQSIVGASDATDSFDVAQAAKVLLKTLCTVKDFTDGDSYNYDSTNNYCANTQFYYYELNYIKKVLSSSGEFDNNITWYRKNNGQIISAGIGFAGENALKSAISRAGESYTSEAAYDWSIMGTKNVYPISLTTRRNMYQYYYTFKGLGNYFRASSATAGRDEIGRIMGYENSVVLNNSRVCFYEVYESACICCGDSGVSYLTSDSTEIETSRHVDYIMSSKYREGSGYLGFNTSSVSLYSLNNASSNILGENWQANDEFAYNGKEFTTDKGKILADAIQKQGEDVYSNTPEYSYTLTPDAMSDIRRYNEGKTYGFASGTLYSVNSGGDYYAYLAYSNDINNFNVTADNIATEIKFSHYGSIFLRDYLNLYETAEYKKDLLTNKKMTADCYVTASTVGDIYSSSKYAKCKWVDYIEVDGSNYYRLAFK